MIYFGLSQVPYRPTRMVLVVVVGTTSSEQETVDGVMMTVDHQPMTWDDLVTPHDGVSKTGVVFFSLAFAPPPTKRDQLFFALSR